jgi:hypothetical protein
MQDNKFSPFFGPLHTAKRYYLIKEVLIYYSFPNIYLESYSNWQMLFGAEIEFIESIYFLNYFHTRASLTSGYKPMRFYNLQNYIYSYLITSNYTPAQGLSPTPIYISITVFLGVKY